MSTKTKATKFYAEPTKFSVEMFDVEYHTKMTEAEYRALPALNQSYLKDCIALSPANAQWNRKNRETTPAMEFGSALHAYVLDKGAYNSGYCIAPDVDRRTKEGKAEYAAFLEQSAGKTPIKAKDFERIVSMDKAVDWVFEDKDHFAELAFTCKCRFTSDDEIGQTEKIVPLKAKLDWVRLYSDKAVIKDLKSVADVSDIPKVSHYSNWAMQVAMYSGMVKTLTEKEVDFYYVTVANEPPHDYMVWKASEKMVNTGQVKLGLAIHRHLFWEANGNPDTASMMGIQTLHG